MKLSDTHKEVIGRSIEEAHASYRKGWCHGARGVPPGIYTEGSHGKHVLEYERGREDGKASFDRAMARHWKAVDATRKDKLTSALRKHA